MLQGWKAHSTSNEGRTARRPQVLTDQFVGWNSRTFPATARAPQAVRPPRCCDKRATRVAAYGSQAQTTTFVPRYRYFDRGLKRLRQDTANVSDGSKADMAAFPIHVRFVPKGDIL